jgi:ribosomal protein S18 acetylase RimI-like enzyme
LAPSNVSISKATPDHAAFVAQTILTASRGQLPRGPFDISLERDATATLAILTRVTLSALVCNCHISKFLVAYVDGRPAGALAAFDPGEKGLLPLNAVLIDVCRGLGHDEGGIAPAMSRIAALEPCFPRAEPGTWTIGWVATDEGLRRRGICSRLLEAILAEGARHACRTAQVSTYLGNDAAITAYARAGFRAVSEHRHPACAAMLGVPGLLTLRRDLP